MKKVLIIIPAYNEEKSLEAVVSSLKLKNVQLDYVIVNDGSKDNTVALCEEKHFNYLNLINNLGIGGAVQTGYRYAYYHNYDIAIQFDGDNQHDAKFIPALVEAINDNNNLVVGSRFVGNLSSFKSNFIRRFGSRFLSGLIKLFTGEKIYDVTSGFRAADKELIKYFAFNYPSDYPEPDSLVQVIKLGYKVKEIPVVMRERTTGKSS